MNLLKKSILIIASLTTYTFSSEQGLNTIYESDLSLGQEQFVRYDLVYEKRNARITYFLQDINVIALTKGNKMQQIEAFDEIANLCLKPSESREGIPGWFEVLFYMMITNRKEYFAIDPSVRPEKFQFIAVDSSDKHVDITSQLLGIMPSYFVDFKIVRLKNSFSQCSNICKFLEQFEQLILNKEKIKNIAEEKEALEQKCQNDIFKEIAGIAGDKIKYKYKELRLLMALIEAREVVKINTEQLEEEKKSNIES